MGRANRQPNFCLRGRHLLQSDAGVMNGRRSPGYEFLVGEGNFHGSVPEVTDRGKAHDPVPAFLRGLSSRFLGVQFEGSRWTNVIYGLQPKTTHTSPPDIMAGGCTGGKSCQNDKLSFCQKTAVSLAASTRVAGAPEGFYRQSPAVIW